MPPSPRCETLTAVPGFYEEFGRRVREARELKGISQRELAERLRMTRSSVANVEAGRQRVLVHQAVQIAEAIGVQVYDLIPAVLSLIDQQVLDLPPDKALLEISDRWTTYVPRSRR